MATVLGNLIIQLSAQTDAFQRGMADAKRISFDTSADIIESLKRVSESFAKLKFDSSGEFKKSAAIAGGVVAGIGVAVAGTSVVIAKEVAEQAKQMSKLAQSYGLPVDTISQLRVASKLTGVGMEELSQGMGRFAKSSAAAAEGGHVQQAAFAALGIQVTDSSGHLRPMNELLVDAAGKFSKLQDGTGKTALAMQLFGRAGAGLIPFLNSGSDGLQQMLDLSNQLGLTWSKEDAESAELFQQRVELLDLKTTALKENFVKGLLPALDGLSTAFIKTDSNGNSFSRDLGGGIGTIVTWAATQFDSLTAVLAKTALAFEYGPWNKSFWTDQKSFIAEYGAALAIVDQQHENFVKALSTPSPLIKTAGQGTGNPTFSDLTGPTNPDKGLTELLDKARQLFDKTQGDSLATQVSNIEHLKIQLQQFAALHPDQIFLDINAAVEKLNIAEGELIAKYQGALQNEIAKGAESQIGKILATPSSIPTASGSVQAQSDQIDLTKNLNEQNRMRLQIYEQTRTPLERYMSDVDTLNLLYKDKSSSEYLRALQDANERLTEAYNPAIKLQKAIEQLNDAYRVGAVSLAQYQQQMRQLQAQQALAATQTNPQSGLGGIKQGLGAGAQVVGAQWQGLSAETANATTRPSTRCRVSSRTSSPPS